jgi:hypothetical protein
MSKTVKNIIIGAVVIIVAMVAYRFFFVKLPEALLEGQVNQNQTVGRELLALLNTLNSLTLEDEVFDRSEFVSLTDFSVPISPNALGRRNPFAPIGVGNVSSQTSSIEEEGEVEESETPSATSTDTETSGGEPLETAE